MARPSLSLRRRTHVRRARIDSYLLVVGTLGCAALLLTLALDASWQSVTFATVALVALLVLGETTPIRVPGQEDEVTTSSAFSLALLILFGLAPAAAAQAVASAVADLLLRKPARTVAFNAGQYTLSLAAAAAVLAGSDGFPRADQPGAALSLGTLGLMALAGCAYFTVNNLLAGTASALSSRQPILAHLRQDLGFQTWSAGLVLAFTPLVVGVTEADGLLIPFLLVPLLAIHRAGNGARTAERQALHDALTGLPNRLLFRTRAQAAIREAEQAGTHVCVLMMDLDRFKEVNDTLGHHHGDLLLQHVAERLRESVRGSETIARFGGDEFAVLMPGLDSAAEGERVARRVLEALRRPMVVKDLTLRIDASLGIAACPEHGMDVDDLLKRADVAMYVAKAARSGVEVYAQGDDSNSLERLALATDLLEAVEREEFVLHYQPQIAVGSSELVGAEALIRWYHPERGMIPPDAFIALAENTGSIGSLTSLALRMAVTQIAKWRAAGFDCPVAVNVSAQDVLGRGLVEEIGGLLVEHDVPAEALKLELTESMLLADPLRAKDVLDALTAMGVRIAIDDFGTGYSSLAYLTKLPIDELKIDRSFIARLHERDSAVIVHSTIDLARRLGLRTVAEGVEDEAMLATLAELRCDIAQGYLFSRPLPPEQFLAWGEGRPRALALPAAA